MDEIISFLFLSLFTFAMNIFHIHILLIIVVKSKYPALRTK